MPAPACPTYASLLADPPRLRLRLRVQPRAPRSRLAGTHGDAVKVQVAAPAVEGAANTALVALLAELFAVRRSDVAIVSGEHSRTKVIDLSATDPKAALQRLEVLLAARRTAAPESGSR